MEMNEGMRKPIMPTLEAMEVGDVEQWPIERLDTVRVTVGRLNAKKARESAYYSMAMDKKNFVIEVTRKK